MPTTSATDLYEAALQNKRTGAKREARRVTFAQPKSAEDIATILTNTSRYPSPVRPLGSGSSATRCGQTATGTLIDMSLLDRVLAMTSDTVTVQAGIRLRDLAEYLADEGMELVCGCADPNRTVGGAISSATLGANMPGEGTMLSSAVVSLTLINGLGRKVDVTDKLPDLLVLTRMSFGLLGVVYSVKLRIRPIRGYTLRTSKMDYDELIRVIPTLLETKGAVRASVMPFRKKAYVELRHPSDAEPKSADLPWKIRDWATNSVLPSVVRSVSKMVPVKNLRDPLIDGFTEATHVLFGSTMATSGSNSIEQTGRFKALRAEPATLGCVWYFPVNQVEAMLEAYLKFCARHYKFSRFRCDLPAELWRMDMDRFALLSPSFDGTVFAFNLRATDKDMEGWDDYLFDFAEFAANFEGIPAFNQTKGVKPGYAAKVYGQRLERFRDIRTRLDPRDRLLNQYFAEHLR